MRRVGVEGGLLKEMNERKFYYTVFSYIYTPPHDIIHKSIVDELTLCTQENAHHPQPITHLQTKFQMTNSKLYIRVHLLTINCSLRNSQLTSLAT